MKSMPDYRLERLALNELPAEERRKYDTPEAKQALAQLAESDRRILAAYPPAEMARRIRERAAAQGLDSSPVEFEARPGRPRLVRRRRFAARLAGFGMLPLAAAAALAVAFGMLPGGAAQGPAGQAGEETRIKGLAPRLVLYRKAAGGSEALPANSRVKPRDLLQLGYVAAGRAYGAILSLDGRGTVTLHYPERGTVAAGLEPSGEVLLPFAYELDDAPRFETFFLVTSERPFELEAVRQAAGAAAALAGRAPLAELRLDLKPGFEQSSFTLIKE